MYGHLRLFIGVNTQYLVSFMVTVNIVCPQHTRPCVGALNICSTQIFKDFGISAHLAATQAEWISIPYIVLDSWDIFQGRIA